MAKAVEDTAFYRYTRFVCLNEVGGHAQQVRHVAERVPRPERRARAQLGRCSMITTSTHDTKRGEDVSARIAVLSELPEHWQRSVEKLHSVDRAVPRACGRQLRSVRECRVPVLSDAARRLAARLGRRPGPRAADRAHGGLHAQGRSRGQAGQTSWLRPNAALRAGRTALRGAVDRERRAASRALCAERADLPVRGQQWPRADRTATV